MNKNWAETNCFPPANAVDMAAEISSTLVRCGMISSGRITVDAAVTGISSSKTNDKRDFGGAIMG